MDLNSFLRAKQIISEADAIIVFAGSGMSAPSGAPTFRGNEGFWKAFPPYEKLGINFVGMANPNTFYNNHELALGFYGYRKNLYESLTPHDGYNALKRMMDKKLNRGWVVTTNVDGHFQKAGFENVWEYHGTINYWQCSSLSCAKVSGYVHPPTFDVDVETMTCKATEDHFCHCKRPLRPNILMFCDCSFSYAKSNAQESLFDRYVYSMEELRNIPKVAVIEIGAGEVIPSMRVEAHKTAKRFFTKVIRISMDEENETHDDRPLHLQGDACEILMKLEE